MSDYDTVEFEWDEGKRLLNLAKHGLDFRDAENLFDGRPHLTVASVTDSEHRFLTTGILDERFVTLVWTERMEKIRFISLRRARNEERREYCKLFGGRN